MIHREYNDTHRILLRIAMILGVSITKKDTPWLSDPELVRSSIDLSLKLSETRINHNWKMEKPRTTEVFPRCWEVDYSTSLVLKKCGNAKDWE